MKEVINKLRSSATSGNVTNLNTLLLARIKKKLNKNVTGSVPNVHIPVTLNLSTCNNALGCDKVKSCKINLFFTCRSDSVTDPDHGGYASHLGREKILIEKNPLHHWVMRIRVKSTTQGSRKKVLALGTGGILLWVSKCNGNNLIPPVWFRKSIKLLIVTFSLAEVDPLAKTQSEGETDVEENIVEQQRLLESEDLEMNVGEGREEGGRAKEVVSAIPEGSDTVTPMDTGSLLESRSRTMSSPPYRPPAKSYFTGSPARSERSSRSSGGESVMYMGESSSSVPPSGFMGSLYGAIKKMRYAALAPRLLGGTVQPPDERYGHLSGNNVEGVFFRHVYEGRSNIACSFDPRTLLCHTCEGGSHSVLYSDLTQNPKCYVLSDQSHPAVLSSTDPSLGCWAIIRVEDGTPMEMVDTFRKIMEGKRLQIGSVILASSLSHLGRYGTARYVEDITGAITQLENDYKGRVRVLHGLPLPQSDIHDKLISRSLLDTLQWLMEVDKRHQHHLPEATKLYMASFLVSSANDEKELSGMRNIGIPLSLPNSVKGNDKNRFHSVGNPKLVADLHQCTGDDESEFLRKLTEELNGTFALNLDPNPVKKCGAKSQMVGNEWLQDVNVVVAGGSHAGRLAQALQANFNNVVDLTLSGWKLSERAATDLAEDIREQTPDHLADNTVVILQIFDNAIFRGHDENGKLVEPFRKEGKYHILGHLSTASEEELKYLFALAAPVIRAAKKCPVILLSPLYRYVTGRCCSDPTHCTNYPERDFTSRLGRAVQAIGKQLKTLIWQRHWRSVSVMNPAAHMGIGAASSMTGEEADLRIGDMLRMWGPDPVHPTSGAYKLLAEAISDKIAVKMDGEKSAAQSSSSAANSRKRPRRSPELYRRVSWVHDSHTEVYRQSGSGSNAGSASNRSTYGYGGSRSGKQPMRGGWFKKGSGLSGNAGPRGGPSGNAGPRGGLSGNAGHHKRSRRGF